MCASGLVTDRRPDGNATALFCGCRAYRYSLTRRWGTGPFLPWIMLNPSTADALKNDPTISRVMAFARAWGYGGIVVINLFALRSPDPRVLKTHPDPAGPFNDSAILGACGPGAVIVAAWGAHGGLHDRDRAVTTLMSSYGTALWCLGLTKGGFPVHPLARGKARIPDDAQLIPYRGR